MSNVIGEPAPAKPSDYGIQWTEELYAEYLRQIEPVERRERTELTEVLNAVTKKYMPEKEAIAISLFRAEAQKCKA